MNLKRIVDVVQHLESSTTFDLTQKHRPIDNLKLGYSFFDPLKHRDTELIQDFKKDIIKHYKKQQRKVLDAHGKTWEKERSWGKRRSHYCHHFIIRSIITSIISCPNLLNTSKGIWLTACRLLLLPPTQHLHHHHTGVCSSIVLLKYEDYYYYYLLCG